MCLAYGKLVGGAHDGDIVFLGEVPHVAGVIVVSERGRPTCYRANYRTSCQGSVRTYSRCDWLMGKPGILVVKNGNEDS